VRIGLISDTHMPGALRELWPQILDAFDGVDYILHGGDLYTTGVIDQLNELARVYVSRGNGDIGVSDERLQDTWLLELGGISIRMIHEFPTPKRRSEEFINQYMNRKYPGARPDVVLYGHTHRQEIHTIDGMLCVNPGSPTLPNNQSLRLGTIGFLDIDQGIASATNFQLTESGIEPVS
jgi:putative phosphoesterase